MPKQKNIKATPYIKKIIRSFRKDFLKDSNFYEPGDRKDRADYIRHYFTEGRFNFSTEDYDKYIIMFEQLMSSHSG